MVTTSLANRIRDCRLKLKLSQAELARMSGTKQSHISKLELGRAQGTRTIAELAKALQVEAYWLATGKQEKRIQPATNRLASGEAERRAQFADVPQSVTRQISKLNDYFLRADPEARKELLQMAEQLAGKSS